MRILIVAENVSARFGGEAILPLKYFTLLRARGIETRMIAHARNRDELSALLPDAVDDILYIEDTIWHRAIWSVARFAPGALRDHLFGVMLSLVNEFMQRQVIRRLVADGKVDVIHQPIPVSPAAPSMIYGLGVPVVIGPMNGGMAYPPDYRDHESRAVRAFMRLGRGLSGLINRMVPGKRRAAVLLVANERTRRALPVAHPRVIELVENGVDFAMWQAPETVAKGPGFRLVFMGRLVDWKALDVTLDALALARAPIWASRWIFWATGQNARHWETPRASHSTGSARKRNVRKSSRAVTR